MHRSISQSCSRIAQFAPLILTIGCGGATDSSGGPGGLSDDLVSEGERIFRSPVDDGNTFACATCHAIREPSHDGLRRVGHPLFDATRRPSYKNGQLQQPLDAINSCLQEWMNADPWDANDSRWQALEAFLASDAPDEDVPALRFDVVPPPPDDQLAGGNADSGQSLFNRSCSACHGENGGGTQLAIRVGGRGLDPAYIAQRVRNSGKPDSPIYDDLTGGIMPFWAADRLSDDELRDLIAWLVLEDEPGDPVDPIDNPTPTDPPDPSDCSNTHPMIGATAVLEEKFHDVGGTAEIIDDCTIQVRDFTFDGEGIEVRFYGGLNGEYDDGFSISENLLKPGGYQQETLTLTLPEGRTMNDLDGVSVWCVPVGADFGSGMFNL